MRVITIEGFLGENRAIHAKLLNDKVGTLSNNQKPGRGDLLSHPYRRSTHARRLLARPWLLGLGLVNQAPDPLSTSIFFRFFKLFGGDSYT